MFKKAMYLSLVAGSLTILSGCTTISLYGGEFEPDQASDVYSLTVFVGGNGEFNAAWARAAEEARLFISTHEGLGYTSFEPMEVKAGSSSFTFRFKFTK